ncbi:glycosyltransferase [Limnobaculum xujianqingii]|uniref:glycosyltransferase n=1 Tax=Limnobaculum xujianqingii TaxID=2738837 RepID=UPI00112E65C6|nr:glycosyltransferase family 2 protein [Limnobaculum xujianqingii]
MNVVISVVSHNHFAVIKRLQCLPKLAKLFTVYVIDNVAESGLNEWCDENKINYLSNKEKYGFGQNNNIVFNHYFQRDLNDDDWFLVLNPDVSIEPSVISSLINNMTKNTHCFAAINLFKDFNYINHDNSIRHYPSLFDFISSYIFGINKTIIDKNKVTEPIKVDWASGSFMMFRATLFKLLNGFDEKYFMYCEDIDICYRAYKIYGKELIYYPQYQAVHLAAHSNRKLLSKSFIWHVKSIVRFLILKNKYHH